MTAKYATLAELAAAQAALREFAEDVVRQWGYVGGGKVSSGGLSTLEDAFVILGWDDPYPLPDGDPALCDVSGCGKARPMTDPQAEAVAALAGAIADHDDICSRMAIPECSDLILAAIQQDPAARAALVAVLAPPSPEPLRAALALLLTATDERTDCYEHADNCCSDWCESCKRGRIAGRCLREARKKARAALAHTEPAPEGEPHPDPLWRAALANTEPVSPDPLHDHEGFCNVDCGGAS